MLLELRVQNLLLIERAELRLGPGLNALTGETGAGKTMLAHALDLLLGGRPRPGVVRPGAGEAYVEGIFEAGPDLLEGEALADLRERVGPPGEDLVLGRRVGADGRTRAFVQGRSATVADLRELGGRLLAFYGQHEHRRLTIASAQLEALDAFCGPAHLEARTRFAAAHRRVLALRRELDELQSRTGTRERDRDLLAFELREIEELEPSLEEKEALLVERDRLRGHDALRHAAAALTGALAGQEGEDGGVGELLARAEQAADQVTGVDPGLDALADRLRGLRLEAEDLGTESARYLAGLEAEPGRIEEVEERLEGYDRLERKHGGSVEAVLGHAERCRGELTALEDSGAGLEAARLALEEAEAEAQSGAAALTEARRSAAPRLAERVSGELSALAMEGACFSVELTRREEHGLTGADGAEFLLAPNPGVPATALRETASGGELSRVMLALMGVVSSAGARGSTGATLVFDEVDAGIGGQTARTVGERLRGLAASRQVLCITHLLQIASLAERHFSIEKDVSGEPARATVTTLGRDGVLVELCRMLGADASDMGARRHAKELLKAA